LGDGTTTNRATPTDVTGMLSGVTAVVAGDNHTCAIKAGTATCWGANNAGQLGAGSFTASVVAAGGDNTCAINSGALTCWGANGGGQLGNGTTTASSTAVTPTGMGSGVSAVAINNNHACAVKAGSLWCWGANLRGQLGVAAGAAQLAPVQVAGLSSVTAVAVGTESTCAIDAGALKCWGYKMANGTAATSVPTITGGMTSGVTAVSLRASTMCAVANGAAKCLGVNTRGQLGNGIVSAASYLPVQPTGMGSGVSLVAAGTKTSCAVQSNLVYCWGDHVYGQAAATGSR